MANLTYTQSRNLYGTLTNNSSTSNLILGDTLIWQFTLELIHKFPFIFGEKTFTLQTLPSTQFTTLPMPLRKVDTVQVQVGSFLWPVREVGSLQEWNNINLVSTITSDTPQYFFYYNGQIGLYPIPATGYNAMYVKGQIDVTNLSVADVTETKTLTIPYAATLTTTPASGDTSATLTAVWPLQTGTYQMVFSSGNIRLVTLTNSATTVTWSYALTAAATTAVTVRSSTGGDILTGVSNTSWSTKSGYVLTIAQPTGDGFPYIFDTIYDSNHASILGYYNGYTVSAASTSFTVGQTTIVAPSGQMIPIYRAAEVYYTTILKDEGRAKTYADLADKAESALRIDYGNKDTDPTINDGHDKPIINPNLTINTTQSTN